jgi:putative ABC transport system permease protein
MIKNYFKLALRNLLKNKGFSAINILGLSIGVATCLLISLYIFNELSFDKFNTKADRIYRIDADIKFGENPQALAVNPDPMAATLVKEFPEVESAVRFRDYGSSLVKKGNQNIKETRIIYTDSSVFDVFTLPFLEGQAKGALSAPKTMVLTESAAKKYFNSTHVIGESLKFDNTDDYKITGVIKDLPENSHFSYDLFLSLEGVEEAHRNTWLGFNFATYVVLKPGTSPENFQHKLGFILDKYVFPQAGQILNISKEDFVKSGNYVKFLITPLNRIHLHSDRLAELGINNDIQVIYIFGAVAVFILIIACINFMNLSTARSANRAREVGVRKVLGTVKGQLIAQFLMESVLMSFIAFIIAMLLVALLLPYLNQLSGKHLTYSSFLTPRFIAALIGGALLTGFMAGIYPSFYLSSFKPVQVLKGGIANGFKRSYLRSGLVVFQFFISITLIISTIVIYRQLQFIHQKKIGFNKEQVITVKDTYVLDKKSETFKNEVLKYPEFISGSQSGYLPVTPSNRSEEALFAGTVIDNSKAVSSQLWSVDEDYIKTFGMEMQAGRSFSKEMLTDSNAVVINETAAKLFGFKNPLGEKISLLENIKTGKTQTLTVIGVVKNFHFQSLRENIGALTMRLFRSNTNVSFRIRGENASTALDHIRTAWKSVAASEPLSYSFLNEDFDAMYRSEQRSGQIFISFAVLAILIACLGLFGLAAYAAEQRVKEIGIRKVLGASVAQIFSILSKDFLKLVVIAAVIAFPLAWWMMDLWLRDFAFRVNIGWAVFVIAGLIATFIALVTISFQAIKAAVANPVKNLRTE